MKINPADVLFAVIITIVFAGPVVALLWFSWRTVVTGLFVFGAVAAFMFTPLAIGGMAWTPTRQNPAHVLAIGWTIAAILAAAAYWFAGKGLGLKAVNVVAGFLVMAWVISFYDHVTLAWWAVGHSEASGSKVERGLQADAREGIPHRANLLVMSGAGEPSEIELLRHRDVLYIEPGTDSTTRVLQMLDDAELHDALIERQLATVADPATIGRAVRASPSYRRPAAEWQVDLVPSFYDRRAGTFSMSPERWLTEVLKLEPAKAQRILARHFGAVPST
jgi:hypothetical protein